MYTATFNAENEFWDDYSPETRKYLEDFNFFDLKPIRPLILATATKFGQREFEKTIRFLTSFSLRLVMSARTRSGANEQAFADAAIKVTNGEISDYAGLTEALKKISVSDRDFEEIFANARVTKTALARYILRELEHSASPSKGEEEWVNADPQQVTLEHILPKKLPDTGWPTFDPDTHSEFKNRLGNLCLLKRSENNGMSNENLETKKPVF